VDPIYPILVCHQKRFNNSIFVRSVRVITKYLVDVQRGFWGDTNIAGLGQLLLVNFQLNRSSYPSFCPAIMPETCVPCPSPSSGSGPGDLTEVLYAQSAKGISSVMSAQKDVTEVTQAFTGTNKVISSSNFKARTKSASKLFEYQSQVYQSMNEGLLPQGEDTTRQCQQRPP
jgi:hypothetical protein